MSRLLTSNLSYRNVYKLIGLPSTRLSQRKNQAKPQLVKIAAEVTTLLYHNPPTEFREIWVKGNIGSGANGKVVQAFAADGLRLAVKIYQKYKIQQRGLKALNNEVSILSRLKHPAIIGLWMAYQTKRQFKLVLQFAGEVSLLKLAKLQVFKFRREDLLNIASQLLEAITYLHSEGFCHRDVKLQNILYFQDSVKLIDFGYACRASSKITAHCGTLNYMAPELIAGKNYDGCKVDVWATGVVLFFLMQGTFPYSGFDEKDLKKRVARGQMKRFEGWDEFKPLMEGMLNKQPQNRMTAGQALAFILNLE